MTKLQDQLDHITTETRRLVQAERLAPGERAVEELFISGIEQRILPVDASAPEFSLPDAAGRQVKSADLLALGPLIVSFFRGRWCPYCVTELETWRELYAGVRAKGALFVAISPQTVRQNDFLLCQHHLPYPVLSDAGCTVATQFGLTHHVPEYHQQYFRSILVNIPLINGDQSWLLPLAATYVLRPDATVAYAQAHADFRVRPEPEDVMNALEAL